MTKRAAGKGDVNQLAASVVRVATKDPAVEQGKDLNPADSGRDKVESSES